MDIIKKRKCEIMGPINVGTIYYLVVYPRTCGSKAHYEMCVTVEMQAYSRFILLTYVIYETREVIVLIMMKNKWNKRFAQNLKT